jgi:hypothetical protein
MTEAVSRLFHKALSDDGSQQLEFVKGIPTLLSVFPSDWISTRLIPFLALWLPLSDDALISATLSTLSLVLSSTGSIDPLAPLVELLLSSDNANASRVVVELVTSSLFDDTLTLFVHRLADSLYDPVRAFVPQVVYLLPSDETKMQIFKKALVDRSFKVRYACARAIADLSDSLARHIASVLQCDSHPRVRGVLPGLAACRPFFLGVLNTHPSLANDPDWAVRAAVASGLVQSPAPHSALVVLGRLISDGVWQVQLCAYRSISSLLEKVDVRREVPNSGVIRKVLLNNMIVPSPILKTAMVDVFLALYRRGPQPEDITFVLDILDREVCSVQLHLLTRVAATKCAGVFMAIQARLGLVIPRLLASELWRERLATVALLKDVLDMADKKESLLDDFTELCLRLVKDESNPVRHKAAEQLAAIAIPSMARLPPFFSKLSHSTTFRDRQAAILVLKALAGRFTAPRDLRLIRAELEKFLGQTECPNVLALAKAVCAQLPK